MLALYGCSRLAVLPEIFSRGGRGGEATHAKRYRLMLRQRLSAVLMLIILSPRKPQASSQAQAAKFRFSYADSSAGGTWDAWQVACPSGESNG